jgi:phosphate transport system permease protein
MRDLLGLLSGIPPIIYAFVGFVFFIKVFSLLEGTLDSLAQSTITAGLLLALLVVPFMTPLMYDAIRNVPYELREASLALGASRWHTLKNVILPLAFPGIISAIGLGVLKSIGDLMIAYVAIGTRPFIPDPAWDMAGNSAPLSSTGAGLAGGIRAETTIVEGTRKWIEYSVSYFTALMLLVIALVVLGLVTFLQWRYRKRYSL